MPIYEYECRGHGVFEEIRSLADHQLPAACPSCRTDSPRILSRPNLSAMPRSQVIARDRNEKSRHEPTVSKGPTCGHQHEAKPKPKPDQLQVYSGPRPWVMEHA